MVQRVARAKPLGRRGARLLVVDDEPVVVRVLQRVLAGHEVVVAMNAKDALGHVLAAPTFDLIFCDLMMPEMSGIQLHSEISAAFPEQATRMVFLTGGTLDVDARAFLHSPATRCLAKPFDVADLLALVGEIEIELEN